MTAQIRLRSDQLAKYMDLAGITKQAQLAEKIGLSEASVCRTINGRTAPGEKSIAGLLIAFDDVDVLNINPQLVGAAGELLGLDATQFQRAVVFASLFDVIPQAEAAA